MTSCLAVVRNSVAVACLFLSSACSSPESKTGKEPSATEVRGASAEQAERRDRWLLDAFPSGSADLATVELRFGVADRLDYSPTPNRHVAGQVDTIVIASYDRGLRVTAYRVTGGPEFIESAEVTAQEFLASDLVEIGQEWGLVVEALGPPQGVDGLPYYECQACLDEAAAPQPVYIGLLNGRVASIRFTFYVD